MAYITGSVTSMVDLLSAIRVGCTANGWTLSNEVLHKGSSFVRHRVEGQALTMLPGRGVDVNNNLTGAHTRKPYINAVGGVGLTFPMTYELFIFDSPDEVYCVVNYAIDCYLWLAWGASPAGGSTTGAWAGGTLVTADTNVAPPAVGITTIGTVFATYAPAGSYATSAGLFFNNYVSDTEPLRNSYVDVNGTWLGPNAVSPIDTLINRQPNLWNGESSLIPIQPYVVLASTKVAPVVDIANARYFRITNYDPGAIFPLGSDRWKVYPFFRKNSARPDSLNSANDTGTFGWAIRYDGP